MILNGEKHYHTYVTDYRVANTGRGLMSYFIAEFVVTREENLENVQIEDEE